MTTTQVDRSTGGDDNGQHTGCDSIYEGCCIIERLGSRELSRKTSIADTVVSKIAGIATREVSGVYDVGGGASRVVGALRERIPGASVNHSQGVSVEVGEKQAAVDIDIVAEYGVSLADLATGIRRNVIAALERMTGLEVTEVNITVHGRSPRRGQ